MKQVIPATCLFGFLALAASAYVVPEPESALDAAFHNQLKSEAVNAIQVGEILCDVAAQLSEDEDLSAEAEEYFIDVLWSKTKSAVTTATAKVKGSVNDAYNKAQERINAAKKEAKRKVTEKAIKIMAKLFIKFMQSYAMEDSNSRMDFMKAVTADIERIGQRLQKQGMAVLEG